MKDILIGFALVIAGIIVIVNRSQWAHRSIEDQNKIFGFHFGKKDTQATSYVGLLVGFAFTVMGVLVLLGIFELK